MRSAAVHIVRRRQRAATRLSSAASFRSPSETPNVALALAHARLGIPTERFVAPRQGCFRHLADTHTVNPVRRADRDKARKTAGAAAEFGIPDRHQCTSLGYFVQISNAFGLRIAVVQQPCLTLQRWRAIGVQRLVSVEQDVPLLVQEFQRAQADARELLRRRQAWIRPALLPVRTDEDHRALRDTPMAILPVQNIGNLQRVAWVLGKLRHDRDDHHWT